MQLQVEVEEKWLIDSLNGYLSEHGKSNRVILLRVVDERLMIQVDKLKLEVGALTIKDHQLQLNIRAVEYNIPVWGPVRAEFDSLRGRVVKLAADKLNLVPILQFKDDLIIVDLTDFWPRGCRP